MQTRPSSCDGASAILAALHRSQAIIEFTMDMPAQVMGWESDVAIHCTGRVVRHQLSGEETMAAAVIDEYFLKAS